MQPDYAGLKSEIANAKYTGQTDAQIVAAINAATIQDARYRVLSSQELLAWCAKNGRYVAIQTAAAAALPATTDPSYANAAALKSVALAAQVLIDRDGTILDLNLADRQQMVAALEGGGVISSTDQSDLFASATTFHNRASELGFPSITDQDLSAARALQ